jgi:hypothetical protein
MRYDRNKTFFKSYTVITIALGAVITGCSSKNYSDATISTVEEVRATQTLASPSPTISPEVKQMSEYILGKSWDKAKEYANTLKSNNPEIATLQSYAEIRIDYINLQNSTEGPKLYEPILAKINKLNTEKMSDELKKQINDFIDEFQQDRNIYYDNASKVQEDTVTNSGQNRAMTSDGWDRIATALDNGDFNTIATETILSVDSDQDAKALYNFARSHIAGQDGDDDTMFYYLGQIPTNYNGRYSELISTQKLALKTKEEWDEDYQFYQKIKQSKEAEAQKPLPYIGMTRSELENSRWGKPTDINKTTTALGTSEQWVYSDYRYVYLENGIVTAIQE